MLIVCDNCGAEYEIDEEEDGLASLPGRGLRFRCSACGHTFGIGGDAAQSASASLSDPGSVARAPAETPPMLLKQEGKVYQVEDVATLQRWIVERRVLREDMFSLGGLKWEPVGSRRDLQVFFHLVDDVEHGASSGVPVAGPPVDDAAGGGALQGAAPWETGGRAADPASGGPDLASPATDSLAADLDEDDGVDAGLPLDGLPPESWHREVPDHLESQGDADSFFTEAGDAGLPVPAVPNLASAERTSDPESAGLAADEEVDPSGGVVPVVLDAAQDSALSSLDPGAEERFDRYLDSPLGSDPFGELDDAPPAGRGRWMLVAAVLIGVGLIGWYLNGQRQAGVESGPARDTTAAPADVSDAETAGAHRDGDQGAAEGAGAEGAGAEGAGAEGAGAEGAGAERAAAEKAAAERAAAERAAAERAAAEKAAAERATAETHAGPPVAPTPVSAVSSDVSGAGSDAVPDATVATAPDAAGTDASADASDDASDPPAAVAPSGSTAALSTKQLVDLGWKSIDAGDYATGRSRFDSALSRSPHDADARFGLGYAYEKLGNLPAAIRQYCKVTRFGYGDALVEAEGRLRALGQRCE